MIYKDTEGLDHLNAVRDGSFKQGLGIGCDLDEHLRYKKTNLVVMAGHANVGKTLSILFYFTCLAKHYDLKFCVFSSENEIGALKDDIISLYNGKPIEHLTDEEFNYSTYWLSEHFKFVDQEGFFNQHKRLMHFRDVLDCVKDLDINHNFVCNSVVLDPYNSLGRVENLPQNQHLYDYTVMAELRIWCKLEGKSCYIMAHGVTEALRKTHPKGHDYEGYTVPLLSADIEGGGKFVNRCDDFVVIHRYTDHKSEWMKTEWHVKKVKNTKTGGRPTFKNNPVILEAENQLTRFKVYTKEEPFAHPEKWANPMEKQEQSLREPKPLEVNKDFDNEADELLF